jgi:hypothetical protein
VIDIAAIGSVLSRATGTGWEAAYRQDVGALLGAVEEALADMAEVREWSRGRGPLARPYRANTAGMLDRLDRAFTRLGEVERTLRAERDEARRERDAARQELVDVDGFDDDYRQAMARAVDAVAQAERERDELALTLANERGDGAGPSEGWSYSDETWWGPGYAVTRFNRGGGWQLCAIDTDGSPTRAPIPNPSWHTARDGMKEGAAMLAADAAIKAGGPS